MWGSCFLKLQVCNKQIALFKISERCIILKIASFIKLTDYQGSEVINMKKEIFGKQLQKASNSAFLSYKTL